MRATSRKRAADGASRQGRSWPLELMPARTALTDRPAACESASPAGQGCRTARRTSPRSSPGMLLGTPPAPTPPMAASPATPRAAASKPASAGRCRTRTARARRRTPAVGGRLAGCRELRPARGRHTPAGRIGRPTVAGLAPAGGAADIPGRRPTRCGAADGAAASIPSGRRSRRPLPQSGQQVGAHERRPGRGGDRTIGGVPGAGLAARARRGRPGRGRRAARPGRRAARRGDRNFSGTSTGSSAQRTSSAARHAIQHRTVALSDPKRS
jgi:hypothetical protein